MLRRRPCVSLAVGIGSVLSIAPTVSNAKLVEVSNFEMSNSSQHIYQYWQNVGRYMKNSLAKAKETNGQAN